MVRCWKELSDRPGLAALADPGAGQSRRNSGPGRAAELDGGRAENEREALRAFAAVSVSRKLRGVLLVALAPSKAFRLQSHPLPLALQEYCR